jgi:hypothetical protein
MQSSAEKENNEENDQESFQNGLLPHCGAPVAWCAAIMLHVLHGRIHWMKYLWFHLVLLL